VSTVREVEGVKKEVEQAKVKHGEIAAFFDLDGTLTELPSLERRFFKELQREGRIPLRNYFSWMAEALRLTPRGIDSMSHANKMYLRGVESFAEPHKGETNSGEMEKCEVLDAASTRMRLPVPKFFLRGVERVEWHARQGHSIFLLSGTLEPLAQGAALTLAVRLALQGGHAEIGVGATQLEDANGCWTGRIIGEAMFGEAKARALKKIAAQEGLQLQKCYAYGDSLHDRWMLAAVGRATAVNPSEELESFAQARGWPVMRWREKKAERENAKNSEEERSLPQRHQKGWRVERWKQADGENLENAG
jgi:HAD superfamily hydrolase (TIGR01490 family)